MAITLNPAGGTVSAGGVTGFFREASTVSTPFDLFTGISVRATPSHLAIVVTGQHNHGESVALNSGVVITVSRSGAVSGAISVTTNGQMIGLASGILDSSVIYEDGALVLECSPVFLPDPFLIVDSLVNNDGDTHWPIINSAPQSGGYWIPSLEYTGTAFTSGASGPVIVGSTITNCDITYESNTRRFSDSLATLLDGAGTSQNKNQCNGLFGPTTTYGTFPANILGYVPQDGSLGFINAIPAEFANVDITIQDLSFNVIGSDNYNTYFTAPGELRGSGSYYSPAHTSAEPYPIPRFEASLIEGLSNTTSFDDVVNAVVNGTTLINGVASWVL
ncbi:MAG: hypothetical protein AAFU85_02150 [Planctomycetota bacterium]